MMPNYDGNEGIRLNAGGGQVGMGGGGGGG